MSEEIGYMSFKKLGIDTHARYIIDILHGDIVAIINSDLSPSEIDKCLAEINRIYKLKQN